MSIFGLEMECEIIVLIWNGPMTSDTVTTQKGKSFTLYNIPLYYAGYLQVFLDRIVSGSAFIPCIIKKQ